MRQLHAIMIMMFVLLLLGGCGQNTQKQLLNGNHQSSNGTILDQMEGPPNNGHTLERHVGKTDEQLRQRIQKENVTAASTYYDKTTAEKAVKEVLSQHNSEIQKWLKEGNQDRLTLNTHHSFPVGKSVVRKDMRVHESVMDTITVLAKNSSNPRGYSIITSYPNLK